MSPGLHSFDGSYMRESPNLNGTDNLVHIYKDGTQAQVQPGQPGLGIYQQTLLDTNGNFIRCSVNRQVPHDVPISCTDSLGRVINFNQSGGYVQRISYADSDGQTQTIAFSYQTYDVFWPYHVHDYFFCEHYVQPLLTRVTLPNNLSYAFEYFR